MKKQFTAYTLVETLIVVTAIGLLAVILIPEFMKSRQNRQKNVCVANLKLIMGVKYTWAAENKTTNNPAWTNLVGQNLYILHMPECQAGGEYTLGEFGRNPTCSIPGHILPR